MILHMNYEMLGYCEKSLVVTFAFVIHHQCHRSTDLATE